MNLVKNIFARLWALWAIILFILTFFIIFIPSMLSYLMEDYKGQIYFMNVSRIWMKSWLWMIGCPPTIHGLENFQKGKNYIVTFNHNALLDPTISAPFIPEANKTIAKASFSKVPIFGWFYARGSVLIDRKNDQSRRRSYEAMKNVLLTGMNMCIYPEGTRNRTKEPLKSFHDGAFKLAVDTKKDIIPAVIIGTKKALPINKFFYLVPTRLNLYFLPPVSSENITSAELKQKVFDIMKDAFIKKGTSI